MKKMICIAIMLSVFSLCIVTVLAEATSPELMIEGHYQYIDLDDGMLIHCNKESTPEENAKDKNINYDYILTNNTENNGLTKYNTFGIEYSLPSVWQHVPISDRSDVFALDALNTNKDLITVEVHDFSEYSLMWNTKSRKQIVLDSMMTGAMESLNMDANLLELTIDKADSVGLLKKGSSDYGITTMYMEIIDNKVFCLYSIGDSNDRMSIIIKCIYSIKSTETTIKQNEYKKLENKGTLIQKRQGNVVFSVWDDWISIGESQSSEQGISTCNYLKTNDNPSDGMLYVAAIDNIIDNTDNSENKYQVLLDELIETFNLTNVETTKKFYLTKNSTLGYMVTTMDNVPMNCSIFVCNNGNTGYCFVMMSSNVGSINTAWLETVINTIHFK